MTPKNKKSGPSPKWRLFLRRESYFRRGLNPCHVEGIRFKRTLQEVLEGSIELVRQKKLEERRRKYRIKVRNRRKKKPPVPTKLLKVAGRLRSGRVRRNPPEPKLLHSLPELLIYTRTHIARQG